jgi:hypothetical protein
VDVDRFSRTRMNLQQQSMQNVSHGGGSRQISVPPTSTPLSYQGKVRSSFHKKNNINNNINNINNSSSLQLSQTKMVEVSSGKSYQGTKTSYT